MFIFTIVPHLYKNIFYRKLTRKILKINIVRFIEEENRSINASGNFISRARLFYDFLNCNIAPISEKYLCLKK